MNDRETVEQWPELYEDVPPLPGGLSRLQTGIAAERERGRSRAQRRRIGGTVAAVLAGAVLWLAAPPRSPWPDRSAAVELLTADGQTPHPRAAMLGLVEWRSRSQRVDDRLPDSEAVMFRWVAPTPVPSSMGSEAGVR